MDYATEIKNLSRRRYGTLQIFAFFRVRAKFFRVRAKIVDTEQFLRYDITKAGERTIPRIPVFILKGRRQLL